MKLNLGSGPNKLDGYVNIDRLFGAEVFPLTNVRDESCEEVRASHILEHFSHRETRDVLREWIRILEPGGWLRIAVPDFAYIAQEYLRAETDEPLQFYCMGAQIDENDYHKALFDEDGLREVLEELGLVNVQRWKSEIRDCASLPVSLNLMGQKPDPNAQEARVQQPEVVTERVQSVPKTVSSIPAGEVICVMSMPRLSFTDNTFCVLQGIGSLGIRVIKSSGVFWGQCLESMIDTCLSDGAKYVLTVDYDTLFTKQDVLELYTLAETHHADALFPLQMKRDEDNVPLFARNKLVREETVTITRDDLDVDLFPAASGHFGLTLLRAEAIQKVSRPLFHSVPAPDGKWGEGRMDEDIHFWHKWVEAGNAMHLTPRVVLGHLQLVATYPDKNMQARHQYLSEYHKRGKPEWAW